MSVFSTLVLVLGGTATIIAAVVAVYRIARRVEQAIGTDSRGRTISERLDRVEYQLWENGGSSLADRVNRIQTHSIETSTEVKFIKDLIINNSIPVVQEIPKKRRSTQKPA
jgi:hypothetical protein